MPRSRREPLFSALEYAPAFLVYALHVPYAIYLTLKFRSFTLPAIANPKILTGGICGESKTDLFALVGATAREFFVPFVTVRAGAGAGDVRRSLEDGKIAYPLVAKPDIGRNGRGVKIVHGEEELMAHLSAFPRDARMVLQRYVSDEGEAGVFYVRKPSEAKGRITSLTLKYFPSVIGDGTATVRELILRDPRASKIARIYLRRNAHELGRVPARGEPYRLVSVGNHVRGAVFEDGAPFITPELTETFDRIGKDIDGFYFGRFDVRFASLDEFAHGRGFSILEYNGASSEPTHVWDRRTGMFETYRQLLLHWRYAFEVGAEHRARGVHPIPLGNILRICHDEEALIEQYPDEE